MNITDKKISKYSTFLIIVSIGVSMIALSYILSGSSERVVFSIDKNNIKFLESLNQSVLDNRISGKNNRDVILSNLSSYGNSIIFVINDTNKEIKEIKNLINQKL